MIIQVRMLTTDHKIISQLEFIEPGEKSWQRACTLTLSKLHGIIVKETK